MSLRIKIESSGFSYQGKSEVYSFEDIIKFLWCPIDLADDFSVRNIMQILSKNPEFYSLALSSSFLVDLIDTYESIKDVELNKNFNSEVDEIVCTKFSELWDFEEDESKEFSIDCDLSGRSNSSNDLFSLTFSNLQEILDIPLKINNDFSLFDWSLRKKSPHENATIDLGKIDFKLIELLECFVQEVTFLGTEENKEKEKEILSETIKQTEEDIKNGKLHKFSNIKELFKDLEID